MDEDQSTLREPQDSQMELTQFRGMVQQSRSDQMLDVDECCKHLASCSSDEHCLLFIAYLPEALQYRILTEAESGKIVRALPLHLLRKLLIDLDSENKKEYRDLAINVLSVLLPQCTVNDAYRFEPLIEPLLASILSNRDWEVSQLETACNVLLRISNGLLDVDDVTQIVRVLSKTLHDTTEQLPSLVLLGIVSELLKRLIGEPESVSEENSLKTTTPTYLRVVITRLLRTEHLPEEYRSMCFTVCSLLVCSLGVDWLRPDPQFVVMMAALTHVQLHMELDDPTKIRVDIVVACATLVESFMQCIETDDDFLTDQLATLVSRSCHDSVAFVCEYLVECRKDEQIELDVGLEVVIYRLVCSFLAVGGQDTMEPRLVENVLPILFDIARASCERGDAALIELMLPSLARFRALPNSCLGLLLRSLQRYSSHNPTVFFAKVASVVYELKNRCDWYTSEDLMSTKEVADQLANDELIEAFAVLRSST